jgi:hypothetical protein
VYRKEALLAPRPAHMGDNSMFSASDVPKIGNKKAPSLEKH